MFSIEELFIVIVLYNEKLANTSPFENIRLNYLNVDFFVYDNSPQPDNDVKSYYNVTYIHNPSNPGVSLAYNEAARYAKKLGKKWLLLFDQDTKLPENFLDLLVQNVNRYPLCNLYSMKLFSDNTLMSPCVYKYKSGRLLASIDVGINELKDISFINSGLLMSVELFFMAGGYDVNVPFYYSDFVFVNRLRKVIDKFVLLPIELSHSLSSNDTKDLKLFKVRYGFYLKGAFEAMKSEDHQKMFYYLTTLLRAFKLTIKLKDSYYLLEYFNKIRKL